jgi:hypothetical protein
LNPEKPLDFDPRPLVKGHGLTVSLPLAERLRAARDVPQAVVKVAGYGHGAKGAKRLMRYISRKGELPLETELGEVLTSTDQQKALVDEWAVNFDARGDSRDTVHLIFSMPHGSSPMALRRTIRKVLQRRFQGHEAVFAIHEDKKHVHAHVVVKMFNVETEKKLRLNRPDLYRLREIFAEAAREEGVEMAVSSRAARGVGRKGRRRVAHQLHRKGIVPRAEKETAREVLESLEKGDLREKPWETAMRRRNELERQTYRLEAERLRAAALKSDNDREALLKAAAGLERFSRTMPTPKTLRQAMLEQLQHSARPKNPGSSRDHDGGLER